MLNNVDQTYLASTTKSPKKYWRCIALTKTSGRCESGNRCSTMKIPSQSINELEFLCFMLAQMFSLEAKWQSNSVFAWNCNQDICSIFSDHKSLKKFPNPGKNFRRHGEKYTDRWATSLNWSHDLQHGRLSIVGLISLDWNSRTNYVLTRQMNL